MRVALQPSLRLGTGAWSQVSSYLSQKFKSHLHLWSFLAAVILCGLIFGGVVAGELSSGDTVILANAVQHLLISIQQHQLAASGELWWQRLIGDSQVLALIWLFGVSVIGVPLIVITLFLRAFSIGFAVGFTVLQFGWKGFLVAGIAIFLHQIISMAVLMCAGITAIQFSTQLLSQSNPLSLLSWRFFKYTFVFLLCLLGLMIGAFIQAYLAPYLLSNLLVS